MEMSGHIHASATLPSGEDFPVLIDQGVVWVPEPFWTFVQTSYISCCCR